MKRTFLAALLAAVAINAQAQSPAPDCPAFGAAVVAQFRETGKAENVPPRVARIVANFAASVAAGKLTRDDAAKAIHGFASGYCYGLIDGVEIGAKKRGEGA